MKDSADPEAAPLSKAFEKKQTLWQFYDSLENSFRERRFGFAMQGVQAMQAPDFILGG